MQQSEKTEPLITLEEVRCHNKKDDCWIIIHDKVYDVTEFQYVHPGEGHHGEHIHHHAGKDVTDLFVKYHSPKIGKLLLKAEEKGSVRGIKYIGKI